ncbi:MAG TPA: hypothetical protein P5107_03875 [Thermotogota bacterium]|nr:hypothetical protein [Thermotogota bacterium]HRW34177.1 hypothetical protein [Thermotogota bacterium]
MSDSKPLIPDCVDVDHAIEILSIYHNGEKQKAVQMVREHLEYCAACFKQFHCVSVIEEVVTGKHADDVYLEFIEVVDRIGKNRQIEPYELEELYMDFLSGKCLDTDKGYSQEEFDTVCDFYDKLNELIQDEHQGSEKYTKHSFLTWGAVAALITVTVLSVGILNTSKLDLANKKAFSEQLVFPSYSEHTAYTPTEEKSAENTTDNYIVSAQFGLPVDKELEGGYFNPVKNQQNTLFTVSMNY